MRIIILLAASQAYADGEVGRAPGYGTGVPASHVASLTALDDLHTKELLVPVKSAAERVKDYTAVLVKQERIGNRMGEPVTVRVKWSRPYRYYIKYVEEPYGGREILFVKGKNNDEIIAHKGSFPDITLSLDPFGSTAMDGNHHPITQASLLDFVTVLENNLAEAERRAEGDIRRLGTRLVGERTCQMVEIHFPKGGWYHQVKEDQDLWDIARQYNRSMYQILHHNPSAGWEDADDPDAGDKVFVPRYYASRAQLCIDQELGLPIEARAYDHFGRLYEIYRHLNLQVNVGLSDRDFDTDNPAYNF